MAEHSAPNQAEVAHAPKATPTPDGPPSTHSGECFRLVPRMLARMKPTMSPDARRAGRKALAEHFLQRFLKRHIAEWLE
jgi:hypothetical protein